MPVRLAALLFSSACQRPLGPLEQDTHRNTSTCLTLSFSYYSLPASACHCHGPAQSLFPTPQHLRTCLGLLLPFPSIALPSLLTRYFPRPRPPPFATGPTSPPTQLSHTPRTRPGTQPSPQGKSPVSPIPPFHSPQAIAGPGSFQRNCSRRFSWLLFICISLSSSSTKPNSTNLTFFHTTFLFFYSSAFQLCISISILPLQLSSLSLSLPRIQAKITGIVSPPSLDKQPRPRYNNITKNKSCLCSRQHVTLLVRSCVHWTYIVCTDNSTFSHFRLKASLFRQQPTTTRCPLFRLLSSSSSISSPV